MSDEPTKTVKGVKHSDLNETDRELVWMAANLLTSMPPDEQRMNEVEALVQCYRDDLADAHPAVDPEVLEDMAIHFGSALLLEMERQISDDGSGATRTPGSLRLVRRRVIHALGKYLKMVDPRD